MNRFKMWVVFAVTAVAASVASADSVVNFYVDAAPNVYGSSLWPAFRDAAYSRLANGTAVNMANSYNPANVGTTNFDIRDAVVYSFGDLGKRLHFFYYVPGETTASLTAKNFKVALFDYWGTDPVTDIYGEAGWGTWVTPSSWANYDKDGDGITDGVVGSGGHAWWGAYGVNTQAALDAEFESWRQVGERVQFQVQMDGQIVATAEAQRSAVPEPLTIIGLISAAGGIGAYIRKRSVSLHAE